LQRLILVVRNAHFLIDLTEMLVLRFELLALAEDTAIWIIFRKQKGRAFPANVIRLRMPALTD
jgi:hypothetical protein